MVNQPVKYVVEEINSAYMSYLAQLEERNRQKQVIHQKSEEILKRERLEQGFQLYFNILNANQKVKHTNSSRSRSANQVDKHSSQRTKSAPNLPKQRRIRKAWGDFNGIDSNPNAKTAPKSSMTSSPPTDLTKDILSDSKSTPDLFPYPSTKNMHCRSRKSQNETTIQEIVCYDKDDTSTMDVKQTCSPTENMIEIFSLQLDIFSNWGNKNWVGLTGLELNDPDLVKIIRFQLVNVLKLNSDGIQTSPAVLFHEENLFEEPFQTSNPKHMCFTSIDNLPLRINIKCLMNSDDRIDQDVISLKLWNYNDPKYPDIGIKDCSMKLKTNGRTHVLFNGVLNQISQDRLTDRPKVIDCNLKTGSTTTIVGCNHKLVDNNPDRPLTVSKAPLKVWSGNGETKCWQYLRKVDPFLNDTEEEFYISSNQHKSRNMDKSRIGSLLEESWNSLKFFNHFHAGRINLDKEHSLETLGPTRRDSGLWSDEVQSEFLNSIKLASDTGRFESDKLKSIPTLVGSQIDLESKKHTNRIVCPERFLGPTTIPTLPFGKTLILDIVSTWGDIYYVGLTGIEIFTMDGVNVAPFCQICADPADINILPDYSDDPRVITNLLDGVNWTRDDIHMWLAPYSKGSRHLIKIDLPSWTKPIALLRIWNYNKSRVHASRGAREILIYLDSNPIFRGEISKALGLEFGEPEDFSETILFCTDNDILERIGTNDEVLRLRNLMLRDVESGISHLIERPKTAVQQDGNQAKNENASESINSNDRIAKFLDNLDLEDKESLQDLWIEMELLKPWNENLPLIGLTGIQILDSNGDQIRVSRVAINDKQVLPDDLIHKLFNENFHTCNPTDMWYTEFDESEPIKLRIHVETDFAGLKIWNYNDPHMDTNCGCKIIRIRDFKSRIWTPTLKSGMILLRRGPGHTRFAFGQTIWADPKKNTKFSKFNDFSDLELNSDLPNGFVFQLNLFSSWYDQFYIGLNGLEVIGPDGKPIKIKDTQIFASPSSVNDLNSNPTRSDVRTVDKLVDGIVEGLDANHHCWLAPILPDRINQIFIVFDEPIHVVGLRLWNYTRTPERGVREFAVLLDDRLLFRGYLPKYKRKVSPDERYTNRLVKGILPNCEERQVMDGCNPYYVIPLSQEPIEKFEDPKFILDNSKTCLPEDQIKLINIDSCKPQDWASSMETYLRSRSNINQTLRPTTCISNQPIGATL